MMGFRDESWRPDSRSVPALWWVYPPEMPEYITAPDLVDILPRRIIFCEDPFVLATALVPWARRNPRFTFTCALTVSGLRIVEFRRKSLVRKVRRAMSYMGCERDGVADDEIDRIWRFPDTTQLNASHELRIGRSGFTFDADEPVPQPSRWRSVRHGSVSTGDPRAASGAPRAPSGWLGG